MPSNIGPVQPPIRPGPPENEKNKPQETARFREAMKRESEKVGESDAQKQKKRKPQYGKDVENHAPTKAKEHRENQEKVPAFAERKKAAQPPLKGRPTEREPQAKAPTPHGEKAPTLPPKREATKPAEKPSGGMPHEERGKKSVEQKPITAEERMQERGTEREKPKEQIEKIDQTPEERKAAEEAAVKKEEEKKSEELAEAPAAPAPKAGELPQIPEEKKEIKPAKIAMGAPSPPEPITPPTSSPISTTTSLPPYAHMSHEVLMLFERMVGVITVMQASGIKETTVSLTAPQYASSAFYGTEIVIREFSTAPTAYNISIHASPQALSLLQPNVALLMTSFQHEFLQGRNRFNIHRIDTELLGAKPPRVRRKKSAGEESKEEETK